MRTKKKFDCVQMKWNIQQKLREEGEGLSLDERHAMMQEKILADPILGRWWQKVMEKSSSTKHMVACVAEGGVHYGSGKKR